MSRRPVLFAVLLALLLQAVSLGGHWAGRGNPSEILHDLLHWSRVSHHHDHLATLPSEDQQVFEALAAEMGIPAEPPHEGFHQDQSADSNHHMGMDACFSAMGPAPAGIGSPAIPAACPAPDMRPEAAPADPDLSGPRRPPKSLA